MKLLVLLLAPIWAFKGSRHFKDLGPATLRSEDGHRHKIGGRFHDDRMKELQEVKEALVGMAAEKAPPGGKNFHFYMSTVVHMVNVTMRASLDEQFEADEALALVALKDFETCRSSFVSGLLWPNAILEGGSYGEQTYSGLGVRKKSHNDCRDLQNQKKQLYDACVDDERIRWATVKAACDHSFIKFYNSVSARSTGAWSKQCDTELEIFSNTLPDKDPSGLVDLGDTDTEGYLIAQFNFWDKKLEDFLQAEAVCKNATEKAEAEKKDCSGKLEAYEAVSKDCDTKQDTLDALACQQALNRHTRCSEYDWCHASAESAWNAMRNSMCGPRGKEGAMDDELALVDQIECVISAMSSPDASRRAAQCLNKTPKRDGSFKFTACSKAMPKKEEMQNCGNHLNPLDDPDMAGTVSYVDKYYTGPEGNPVGYPLPETGNDPDHAPPVDVKVCVAPCCTHAEAANKTRGAPPVVNHTNHSMKPQDECATPKRGEDGYIVYEGSLAIDSFNVRGSCADGYKGHAIITACTKKGEPYQISGCSPEVCQRPTPTELQDYKVTEVSLELPFFSVHLECKGLGMAKVAPCEKDGQPYVISGCLPFTCKSPKSSVEEGYQVFEGSRRLDTWDVSATCATGYEGTPEVTPCPTPLTPYSLSGCTPMKCSMPKAEELRDYDVTVVDLQMPSFAVAVKCKGISEDGLEPMAVACYKNQEPFTVKNCKPMACTSPRASAEDGYQVFEGSRMMHDFNVKASCAAGYHGVASAQVCSEPEGPYQLSGCGPKRCVEPGAKAARYYDFKVLSREMPSFNVQVQCQAGASGAPKVRSCQADGGPFTLEGCKPDACKSSFNFTDGYMVFEKSVLLEDFNVSARCANGYTGTAIATSCKEKDTPYLLSGCRPKKCSLPHEDAAYDYNYTVLSLDIPTFGLKIECKSGKGEGHAQKCHDEGEPFTLKGCEPIPCDSPTEATEGGYDVTVTSLNPKKFGVEASCAYGYRGRAQVSNCQKGGFPYHLKGCSPKICSQPHADLVHAYEVTQQSLAVPSFSVSVSCKGKRVGKVKAVPCSEDGHPYTLEGCAPLLCKKPPSIEQVGYKLVERSIYMLDFNVSASCLPGYFGEPKAEVCRADGTSYALTGCEKIVCSEPPEEERRDYEVTALSVDLPSFNITTRCKNHQGSGRAVPCRRHGEAYHLVGCKPAACTSPRKSMEDDGYVVFETQLSWLDFNVKASCAGGYVGKAVVQRCRKGGEPYTVFGCSAPKCTVPKMVPHRYTYTVYNLEKPSFSVAVRCRGHNSSIPKAIPCEKDGEPFRLEGCLPLQCTSPKLEATAGYVVHETSLHSDSFQVAASCAENYVGHAKVEICGKPDAPYGISGCRPALCAPPREIETYSYDLTEHSRELPSFSVTARCKTQATGMVRALPCSQDGDSYTLEGCLPGFCSSTKSKAEGYLVYEANRQMDRFEVSAQCGPDYEGTAVVTICDEPGKPYKVSGCHVGSCAQPSSKYQEAYELTVYSLERPRFSVAAKCRFAESVGRALPCSRSGEAFQLQGCPLGECSSPMKTLEDGYVVYEATKRLETFNVSASCAKGYAGTPVVEECSGHGKPYSLSGCRPQECSEPSDAAKAAYELTILSLQRPRFSVTARCRFSGEAKALPCTEDGGAFRLEGCSMGVCDSPRAQAEDGYVVYEASKAIDKFNVSASCATGYRGVAEVLPCSVQGEAYGLRGCVPELCAEPPEAEKAGYEVTVHSLERPSFSATATCRGGGSATVKRCSADGMPYQLQGCEETTQKRSS